MAKSKKKQKNTFSSKRILPFEPKKEIKPVAAFLNPKTVLAEFKRYGDPFNLVKTDKTDAPAIKDFKCTAAWAVQHEEAELMAFMDLEDKLGNVKILYHGTPTRNIASIAKEGLRPGHAYGLFGAGIYVAQPIKSFGFTRFSGYHRIGEEPGAAYLLRVRIILGKVKECQTSHKWTLKTLQEAGFDSVAGIRGWTASWGGTLNNSEWVVYSPSQVLVEKIFEFQPTKEIEDPYTKRSLSGECCVAVDNKLIPDMKGMAAFKDLIIKKPCNKTGHTQIHWSNGYGWVCNGCIERLKLKIGSRVEIVEKSWRAGCRPPKIVRITKVKQDL